MSFPWPQSYDFTHQTKFRIKEYKRTFLKWTQSFQHLLLGKEIINLLIPKKVIFFMIKDGSQLINYSELSAFWVFLFIYNMMVSKRSSIKLIRWSCINYLLNFFTLKLIRDPLPSQLRDFYQPHKTGIEPLLWSLF